MRISKTRSGSVTVISPRGPIQRGDLDDLQTLVQTSLGELQGRVVLDMSHVPYMDSEGLEMLLALGRERRQAGGSLKLAALSETCREILDLTDLLGEFETFDTPENAVRSFL